LVTEMQKRPPEDCPSASAVLRRQTLNRAKVATVHAAAPASVGKPLPVSFAKKSSARGDSNGAAARSGLGGEKSALDTMNTARAELFRTLSVKSCSARYRLKRAPAAGAIRRGAARSLHWSSTNTPRPQHDPSCVVPSPRPRTALATRHAAWPALPRNIYLRRKAKRRTISGWSSAKASKAKKRRRPGG